MIKIHRWICKNCDTKLYLVVNDELEKDLIRLVKFEAHNTVHVLKTGHEIIHREKEEKLSIL